MNKKFLSAVLFGVLMASSTGTFVSCKDYDDDIKDLQEELNKKASLEEMTQKLSTMETAVADAKKIAEEAKAKAEEALKKAEEGGSGSGEVTSTDLENLKKELQAQISKLASLESVDKKIAALKEELTGDFITSESLQALNEKVDKLSAEVMQIIGHRLTSLALIPTEHINGIAAITLTTLQYTPQRYKAMEEHESNPGNHTNRPVLDHEPVGEARYISTEKNEAYFHVSPSMGVRTEDIELPSFDCITSKNTQRSADVTSNSPIVPTSKEIKDGVLTVTFKKSEDFLGKQITTDKVGDTETFYMASLKVPVTEANYTETEKADKEAGKIEGVYVNSEYSRIEEIVAIPYLANSKTDFAKPIEGEFADEIQKDADNKDIYVHYHDSICLYGSTNNQLVDVEQAYNEPLDLNKLVTVCTTTEANKHAEHRELENYADYGLEFRFALAQAEYLQGDRKTDEQAFAKILKGNMLKSEVYDVDLADNEFSRASIGREPIVRVSLIDTKNGNALIAQRYIKVRWIDKAEEQTLKPFNFTEDIISCKDMFQQLFSQDMNEAIYHQVQFNGGQSMSKTEFHNVFKTLKVKSLMKDGQAMDLSKLTVSTDAAADWNEGSKQQEKDGAEALKNDVDLLFGFLEDAQDNTSYNLVWAMNPATVGTLKDNGNGNYSSTFDIEIEYVDAVGTVGNITQHFTQEIVAPKQEFAYQGTYWKNGIGEGIFNVNPLVFTTNNNGWNNGAGVTPDHEHEYNGTACELKAYSHISADLVNGYIYQPTSAKPENLAQFIKNIRSCADVRFVFDEARFNNYDYLAGYHVSQDGISLWKGTAPATWNNFEYVQADKETLAATIENKMGAEEVSNTQYLPWDFNEILGSGTDECESHVRLHELDKLNGTPAAQALVGKSVPVNLVVEYNEFNVIPVQKFEVFFIDPLTIDGSINGNFVDAEIDGSFLNVANGFNFTDWNGNKVAAQDLTEVKDGEYAHELYDFYGVHNVKFLTDKVTTSLSYDAATNTYKHTEGVKDGKLPTKASLKQMEATEKGGVVDKANAQEVASDPTHLAYFNNEGTPVNVDYKMYISVEVAHKWGVLKKEALEVNVHKAAGTPNN
ncbi:uncharacterized protein BN821_00760 [Bacteroides sp. CAG:98]|nr:uncharacterized protein BN821_00760 [Bacteroides sp. CAG:98]